MDTFYLISKYKIVFAKAIVFDSSPGKLIIGTWRICDGNSEADA